MNVVDRIISFFSPSAALQRVQSRLAISQFRAYDAAQLSGKNKNWRAGALSATSELRGAGNRLRERSREQARNNPYPRRALRSIPGNVVGSGIMPAIRTESGGKGLTSKLKKAWKDWATSATLADWDERKTFYGIQNIAMRAMLESGEVFIVRRMDKNGLHLQILEADHLDTAKDGIQIVNGGYILQGIQFASTGKRVGYWLFQQHPGEQRINFKIESVFFSADDVIHLYEEERPGQQRGIPLGMSSITRSRDFSEYQDAQLIRQKIAACFSVFITKDVHSTLPGDSSNTGQPLERVEPGIIEHLLPGQEVQFAAPPPVEGYAEYSSGVLHEIAAGYDIPYEIMTGDYSQVNFSSARMARMEFSRLVTAWQEFVIIPQLCQRVFDWWVQWKKISGEIRENATVTASWTSPGMEFIDPLKEVKAMVERNRAGLMSWQEAVRQLGYDPEELLEELKADASAFDAAGIKPYSDPRFDMGREKTVTDGQAD